MFFLLTITLSFLRACLQLGSCTSSFSGVYFSCGMVEFSKRFVRFEEPQRPTIKATYHYFQVEYELLTLISTWRVFCLVCDSLLVKIL